MCKCGTRPRENAPRYVEVNPYRNALPNVGVVPTLVNLAAPKFWDLTSNFCSKPSSESHAKGIPGLSNITASFLNKEIDRAWNKYCECIHPCPETGDCKCVFYSVTVTCDRLPSSSGTDYVSTTRTFGMYGPIRGCFIGTEGSGDSIVYRMFFNASTWNASTRKCTRAIIPADALGSGGVAPNKPLLKNLRIVRVVAVSSENADCDDGTPPDAPKPNLPSMPFTPFYFPTPPSTPPERCKPENPGTPRVPTCNCDNKGYPFRLPSLPGFPNIPGFPNPNLAAIPNLIPRIAPPVDALDGLKKMNCCNEVKAALVAINQANGKLTKVGLDVGQLRKDVDVNRQFLVSMYADTRSLKSDVSNVRNFAQNAFKKADEAALLAKQIKPLHDAEMRRINSLQLWIQGTVLAAITAQGLALAKLITTSLGTLYVGLRSEFLRLAFQIKGLETSLGSRLWELAQAVGVVNSNVVSQTAMLEVIKQMTEEIVAKQVYIEDMQFTVSVCSLDGLQTEQVSMPVLRSQDKSLRDLYQGLITNNLTLRTCKLYDPRVYDWVDVGEVTQSEYFLLPFDTEFVTVQILEIPAGRSARHNMRPPLNFPNSGWFSWANAYGILPEERIEYEFNTFVNPDKERLNRCYISVFAGYKMRVRAFYSESVPN